ncbi:MAG: glycosyltransferase family 2 protein [Propionibacteriaceae bacterium]|jgi:rhamnosyltransferase|nr:glycosyltransferase family 2 protein [Propionibacteriaceae bacterium]
MATYNGAQFLVEQLDSILTQTYQPTRLIVRDDGSTDETVAILAEYSNRDPRVIIVDSGSDEEHGAMHNWYSLLQATQSDYADFDVYALADQDDIWEAAKLERLVEAFAREDARAPFLVYSDYSVIDERGRVLFPSADDSIGLHAGSYATLLFADSHAWGHSLAFNRSLLEQVVIDEEVVAQSLPHDAYLAKTCLLIGKIRFLDMPLTRYRRHGKNVSAIVYEFHWRELINRLSIVRLGKVYERVLNNSLMSIRKHGELASFNRELADAVLSVLFRGGIYGVVKLKQMGVRRKQLVRSASLYCVVFLRLPRKLLRAGEGQ